MTAPGLEVNVSSCVMGRCGPRVGPASIATRKLQRPDQAANPAIFEVFWGRSINYRPRRVSASGGGGVSVDVDLVDSKGDDEHLGNLFHADHRTRDVDVGVVAGDVTEHQPQGRHLAIDEPKVGLEADPVLVDIEGGPGAARRLDGKLNVVPRRPAAFSADVR